MAKKLTANQKMAKLEKSQAEFEAVIKDKANPLSKDFMFLSLYDAYCKALEGMNEAYEYLQKTGRYYTVTDKDGNSAPRSNPANADFIKYMQQGNNLNKTLSELLRKEPVPVSTGKPATQAGDLIDL